MLTVTFQSLPKIDGGPIRDQLDEAMSALGFSRENGETRFSTPAVSDVSSDKQDTVEQEADKPKRGRPRRTTAEVVRDEAAENAERRHTLPVEVNEDAPQITASPEDRKEPEPVVEQAKPFTHNDIRGVAGDYVKRYGMAAAQQDGQVFMGCSKVSEIPDDQASLGKVFTAFKEGLDKNPFDRPVVG